MVRLHHNWNDHEDRPDLTDPVKAAAMDRAARGVRMVKLVHLALLVLAIGCGSLFFSHVNDAGFWLVKEYFGLTVGETIKSWSVMETVISVFGFVLVYLLSLVV